MERLLYLRENPQWQERAAAWFHQKWHIPLTAYLESMAACARGGEAIPQWYLLLNEREEIMAGMGAIANDFHLRPELTPNLCAVYVEARYRRQGAARRMLDAVCADLKGLGLEQVYLLTDHVGFYERCGFSFLCMAQEEGGGMARMYTRML